MKNNEGVKVQTFLTERVKGYVQTFLLHFSITILLRFSKVGAYLPPHTLPWLRYCQESEDDSPEIALSAGLSSTENDWWIDSGASQHMTPSKKGMTDYVTFRNPLHVKLADDSILLAYGKGNLHLSVFDGTEKVNITLKDVFYVPKIQKRLLSLPSMTQKDVEVRFKGQFCKILSDEKLYSIGHKHGKLYKLNSEPIESSFFGETESNEKSLSL